ncbi:MAG: transketolase [Roseiflexus sp.]|nr:transketolase [Roseiflexus sp.]MCS7289395.1 transketolase [Roseiflexus sp.]MDW8145082.1 transketolase [Roseiflexaceae bacterium]
MTSSYNDLDWLAINTIRTLSIDAVQAANSGHPGMPLGAAPMAYVLWTRFLRFDPGDPSWPDRDRFVLSAGHGSMLLYSLLHLTGFDLSLDDLRRFRQWGSKTPGHPECSLTPGVEVSTGPLGQGFGNGVGMAIAEAFLAATYNRPGYTLFDHYTYAIVSDGDLMEGVAAEAASLAGHLRLGKLIYLYDDNQISLDGPTSLTFTEDVLLRFAAYGWHTVRVADGNDLDAIEAAIREAQAVTDRPSLIAVRTIIGYGSPLAGTNKVHGAPLGAHGVRATKRALGWDPDATFFVPDEVRTLMRLARERGAALRTDWQARFEAYAVTYPAEARQLRLALAGKLPDGWEACLPSFSPTDGDLATREASGKTIQALYNAIPWLIGGSADLSESTKTPYTLTESFQSDCRTGRVIWFGVREHAMGAILNGMAAHGGVRPYGGTFLVFSDYMRGAIRLAALSHHAVIYIFTHDSIGLGEDGPTHQPVEHLAALRAIPNLWVIRPADANETVVAWQIALERTDGPTALILSRQKLPVFDRSTLASAEGVRCGAYVLRDASNGAPQVILMASGSEVALALAAQAALAERGIAARVVSFPSWELFALQPQEYRDSVLLPKVRARLAIEAGVAQGWERWVGDQGDCISVETFGASAPYQVVFREYGFTVENVIERALAVYARSARSAA